MYNRKLLKKIDRLTERLLEMLLKQDIQSLQFHKEATTILRKRLELLKLIIN